MTDTTAAPAGGPGLIELYQDLHRHPELPGHEVRTAGIAAEQLQHSGFEVTTGVGGHGVVGVLRRGPGPVVALRAELDALPLAEDTAAPYRSTVTVPSPDGPTPVMHACGHDFHLTAALGAAGILARSSWWGTVVVIAQPAEETLTGARALLEDGLYERFPVPDVLLAQHTAPFRAGSVAHARGPLLGGSRTLRITVHGTGGHAGAPQFAVDPIVAAAALVLRLQTVVARETDPNRAVTVTVGRLQAGSTANIVPDRAQLDLTVRAHHDDDVARACAAVLRIVHAEAAASDCPRLPEVQELSRSVATVADREALRPVVAAHRAAFGPDQVVNWPTALATEDFPLLGRAGAQLHGHPDIRSVYWMVGTLSDERWAAAPGDTAAEKSRSIPANHSPRFLPDPGALPTAVRALTVGALAHLARPDASDPSASTSTRSTTS